jgi:hypothetical protein
LFPKNCPPKPEETHKNSNFNGKTIHYPGFEPGTSGLAVGCYIFCTIGFKAFLSLILIHQRAQTFFFVKYKKKNQHLLLFDTKYERGRKVCIPDITLCIQTGIMKYEISSQCKANEKQVSEETNANVGGFFWIC